MIWIIMWMTLSIVTAVVLLVLLRQYASIIEITFCIILVLFLLLVFAILCWEGGAGLTEKYHISIYSDGELVQQDYSKGKVTVEENSIVYMDTNGNVRTICYGDNYIINIDKVEEE